MAVSEAELDSLKLEAGELEAYLDNLQSQVCSLKNHNRDLKLVLLKMDRLLRNEMDNLQSQVCSGCLTEEKGEEKKEVKMDEEGIRHQIHKTQKAMEELEVRIPEMDFITKITEIICEQAEMSFATAEEDRTHRSMRGFSRFEDESIEKGLKLEMPVLGIGLSSFLLGIAVAASIRFCSSRFRG